uniref:KH type-2 domain-containing protein n=1 Tax=Aegilops tauschii subsp. strangulata TaxID=200361 RepID=A0A453B4D3_AEGTS
ARELPRLGGGPVGHGGPTGLNICSKALSPIDLLYIRSRSTTFPSKPRVYLPPPPPPPPQNHLPPPRFSNMALQISKKRKFVADGVFLAELNEMLTRELGEDGFAGVEIRVTPMRTEIIIRATRTQNVLGEKGRRIRELTSVVQKRFNFPDGGVELYAEKVLNRGLCAVAQAESLRYKLLGGLAVRRLFPNPQHALELVLITCMSSVLPCHLHNMSGSLTPDLCSMVTEINCSPPFLSVSS